MTLPIEEQLRKKTEALYAEHKYYTDMEGRLADDSAAYIKVEVVCICSDFTVFLYRDDDTNKWTVDTSCVANGATITKTDEIDDHILMLGFVRDIHDDLETFAQELNML